MCILCEMRQAKIETRASGRRVTAEDVAYRYYRSPGGARLFQVDPADWDNMRPEGGYDDEND